MGHRVTRIAEQVAGAATNGVVTNWLGVQSAAKAVLKAGGNTSPTAQQLAQAENKVLAVNEPRMTSTYIPLAGALAWLGAEAIDHFADGRFEVVSNIGQGIGVPAARDFAEHVTGVVRRKLRKVTVSPPPSFAGGVRAPRAAQEVTAPPAATDSPKPNAQGYPNISSAPYGEAYEVDLSASA